MKIALVTQSYPPMISGAALFSERLAASLSRRGHEVLVLAASERPHPYRLAGPNLVVKRFRSYRNPLRVGQRFALWPHRKIIHCLAEFTPDIIHLQDPLQIALSSLSFSRSQQVPAILTVHTLPWSICAYFPAQVGVRKIVEKGLWRYARWLQGRCRMVVPTQTIAQVIAAHTGLLPQVISCGIDLDLFSPACAGFYKAAALRARLGIPEEAPIILHVGRLDIDKQVDRVVQAAALALQATPAHLLVIGDGTEKTRLKQLCTRLGIGEYSHFPGFISIKDGLPALYQMSTVFVTASEIETQGLVLLEAAACGLPIVAVQVTCLHEIVHHGINGFLLQPGAIVEMADRLTWLIKNPACSEAMGKAGRELVKSHASEKTVDAYEGYYRASIPSAQPQPGFVFPR